MSTINEKSCTKESKERSNKQESKVRRNGKTTTTILGDSMVKNIPPWKLRKRCGRNENFYVKSFSGSTIEDMTDYCKPSLKRKPTQIIVHVGTNDLSNKAKSELEIATEILSLAKSMRNKETDVIKSGLVPRLDEYDVKRERVDHILEDLCKEQGFGYIDNSNIDLTRHLNASELHLNKSGDCILADNLFKGSRQ